MDHDQLFKEVLTTFFMDFLEVFCPELAAYIERESVEFLDKEVFTDVTHGERHEADLVAKAKFRGKPLAFLIHVEVQAQPPKDFGKRMFTYFARFHEKYDLPVYPIALFSHQAPRVLEPDQFRVDFPDLAVLQFRFRAVQLNQLQWQEFEDRQSPVLAAFMATMHRAPQETARVKLACLRMLARLALDPARRQLISGFIDSYLRLTIEETDQFGAELQELGPQEKESVMEIVTSWMEEGLERGRQEGRLEAQLEALDRERRLLVRQLRKLLGNLDPPVESHIATLSADGVEQLGDALLDFNSQADLDAWLQARL